MLPKPAPAPAGASVDLAALRSLQKRVSEEPAEGPVPKVDPPPLYKRGERVTVIKRATWGVQSGKNTYFRKDVCVGAHAQVDSVIDNPRAPGGNKWSSPVK